VPVRRLTPLLVAGLAGSSGGAQEAVAAHEERSSQTPGRVTLAGDVVEYAASAGDLFLENEAGEPRARFTDVSSTCSSTRS
jgi:glutamate synthase domain-containing protein 3